MGGPIEESGAAGNEGTAPPRRVGLVFDDRYLAFQMGQELIDYRHEHPFAEPVAHPSSPVLLGRAKQLMDLAGLTDHMLHLAAFEADDDALAAYHTRDYLARVRELSISGGDAGVGAPMGPGGDRIARVSAGGVMAAVDGVLTGAVDVAYALVRPPGHHAMADRGMGFCIFNNVAVAARHAQRAHGIETVLILDWDVHHGNGTQDAFYRDPSVLFLSIHQDNLFPVGWGALEQIGEGPGEGFTVNVPLPAGTGNRGYVEAFDRIVLPLMRRFSPDLVIVSAGQDASVKDPLGRMALTTSAYRDMTTLVLAAAVDICGGRVVIAQEGGYAPTYAPYCSAAIAEALVGQVDGVIPHADPYGARATRLPTAQNVGLDTKCALDDAVATVRRHWEI